MAKTVKPLTALEVKNAKAADKTYTMFDGGGMYLEVTPKGGKWWRFKFTFNSKARRVSLGTYPATTLDDARKKRDTAKGNIAKGIDPFPPKVVEDINAVSEKTFKEWAVWYMDKVSKDVSEGHLSRTDKIWKKDVYPSIGSIAMNDVKARDIIKIMHAMSDRGARESARKAFSAISRVYQVALANYPDDIERNPCADIKLGDVLGKSEEVHYPIITDDKELGALLSTINEYNIGNGRPISTSIILALNMIAHVFVRPHNIRHANWNDINLKDKQWVIPAKDMKTKKELIVPLSKQVIDILNEAKELNKEGLVFPSPKGKKQPLSDGALVGALRRMGYTKEDVVAHSFRGIFSTIAHEKSTFNHDVIETQLAHSVGSKVSQAYNRAVYLKERTEMMQWYSNHLEEVQNAV